MITMSPTHRFLRGFTHFWCCWRLKRYSFFHLIQNSLAKCWTRLHRFLQYLSADWNTPGGGSTTFVFIMSRWLGVNGFKDSVSFSDSTVRGWLLTICLPLRTTRFWVIHHSIASHYSEEEMQGHYALNGSVVPRPFHVTGWGNVHIEFQPVTVMTL